MIVANNGVPAVPVGILELDKKPRHYSLVDVSAEADLERPREWTCVLAVVLTRLHLPVRLAPST
jgi:hypothetical protein